MSYIPFLKFKSNEVAAIKALDISFQQTLIPFFDFPHKDDMNEGEFISMVTGLYRKYELNLNKLPEFYLDNYDISDLIKVESEDNYKFIIEKFINSPFIPVVGLDRVPERNQIVFDSSSEINSNTVAVRLTYEDLDYDLMRDDIEDLLNDCYDNFEKVDLIIDNRICRGVDVNERASLITDFINKIVGDNFFNRIVVAGSIITASIKDMLNTGQEKVFDRTEVKIFKKVKESHQEIYLGDYTVISPNYSDIKISGELMSKVTAPKIFYAFDERLLVLRGNALETDARGYEQYNDLLLKVVSQSFYRQNNSFGDIFAYEKAHNLCNVKVTPSTIPKPLINLHITFMLKNFIF